MEDEQELEFSTGEMNSFFYTSDKQIEKLDDNFILAKIQEHYPDFSQDTEENLLKQVIIVIFNDNTFMEEMKKNYSLSQTEIIKTIYRNFEYVFNKCFITKIQKTIENNSYAKNANRTRRI